MQHFLFVHFKEKTTPDGEQVYFGVSKDGFNWEPVNGGNPVLWAFYGDKGVRDFTITRCKATGKFYIIATDLSLSYGMRNQYHKSWAEIARNGSKHLALWESSDLVNWSEQRLIQPGSGCDDFGCLWAPDVLFDAAHGDYILHWSSSHKSDDYKEKCIYYSRTSDFEHFSEPRELYRKPGSNVIDSAMYEENGMYYLFVKSEKNPSRIMLLKADDAVGTNGWERVTAFDEQMLAIQEGLYEAPTAVKTDNGKWCLFLDFYGVKGAGQGYVPFISDSLESGAFVRSDADFSFPYGFKHGTILSITEEEYNRVKALKTE